MAAFAALSLPAISREVCRSKHSIGIVATLRARFRLVVCSDGEVQTLPFFNKVSGYFDERYVKHRFYSGVGDGRLSRAVEFC